MRRRIVLIATPWYPVPPTGYGGIELVVDLLHKGLREEGHEVTVFGAEGSEQGVRMLAPRSWRSDLGGEQEAVRALSFASRVQEALPDVAPFDVIHDNSGFATVFGAALHRLAPVVHTVHGPVNEPEATFYRGLGRRIGLVAISDSQRSAAPDLNWVGTVHNAVDLRELTTVSPDEKQGYLLCLARICHDKGQHVAVEVARRTGRRLVLAGKIEPGERGQEYFDHYIAGALDGDRIIHIHNVEGEEKASLIARAGALLAPLQWEEPFGLFMAEAIVSGTPVIAMARGAAPEVVEDNVTGFLVPDVEGMADAVGKLDEIDTVRCADHAREHFSPGAMARGYADVYERVLNVAAQPEIAALDGATSGGRCEGVRAAGSADASGRRNDIGVFAGDGRGQVRRGGDRTAVSS